MNRVVYRAYIKGVLRAESPFLTCGIEHLWDSETDLVFLRDNEGKPFLPGSSLAGALRDVFDDADGVEEMFGTDSPKMQSASWQNNSRQSCLITYDCFLSAGCEPSFETRDGIRLKNDNKVTDDNAKYDYEIVERGAEFDFKLELVARDNNHREVLFKLLNSLVREMREGIHLGIKTNRGLGLFELENPEICEICGEDAYKKYVDFDWDTSDFTAFDVSEIAKRDHLAGKRRKEWNIGISFPATVLIRNYEGKDVSMLTSKNEPVIPGTSWGGLFRHEARRILSELCPDADKVNTMMEEMFGTSAEDSNKTAHENKKASKVAFSDAVIKGGTKFKQTNVKIDRFTQGAADIALFDQRVVAGGKTTLTIRYHEEWMKSLLSLVLADLNDGLIAIGGQTSIGRGLCRLENFKPGGYEALYEKITQKEEASQ